MYLALSPKEKELINAAEKKIMENHFPNNFDRPHPVFNTGSSKRVRPVVFWAYFAKCMSPDSIIIYFNRRGENVDFLQIVRDTGAY